MAEIDYKAELKTILQELNFGLKDKDIDFLVKDGEKCMDTPKILVTRLGISEQYTDVIIDVLRKTLEKPVQVMEEDAKRIEQFLQENPSMDSPSVINLSLDIDEKVVRAYLTTREEREIQTEKGSGLRLHFTGKEGKNALVTIRKYFPNYTEEKIHKSIVRNDLPMKDKLICVMRKENPKDYSQLAAYLGKFKDSKIFLEVDRHLRFGDIKLINAGDCSVDELSKRAQKVGTVILEFLERYTPRDVEMSGYKRLQCEEVERVANDFGSKTKTFQIYRMIIVNPIEQVTVASKNLVKEKIFQNFLPWIFYYIKCYLPLNDIKTIFQDDFQIHLTTHQIFHLVFQLSDSLLRGLCIEHYSYSNPVPLYYPTFATLRNQECKFHVCKELWYSIRENRGLISFGLGQAGFGRLGKSSLLDCIFKTNFVKENPKSSPFHFKSVDIQMTNNLYADNKNEFTKWAFIDCNGYVEHDVICAICQQLYIAIVHVSYNDYIHRKQQVMGDIGRFKKMKYLYVFVRDCIKPEVRTEKIDTRLHVFIPNCTKHNITHFLSRLIEIGKQILDLPTEPCVTGRFIENIMNELGTPGLEKLRKDNQLLNEIMTYITNKIDFSKELNFSFLNFYPIFVKYMKLYYSTFRETNHKQISLHNNNRVKLKVELNKKNISNIVLHFNEILKRPNSVMILWKLSQNLSYLTEEVNRTNKKSKDTESSTNDKYNLEILWREALLSYKYGRKDSITYEDFKEDFAMNFCNYVERGEPFELIDGDNLRYFNQDISALLSQLYSKQTREIRDHEKGNNIKMKQAPIVVSIIGPQSSGKSTLLNYCFGCKFLTSAGRCTRGIYASLAKLSKPVNCSDQFLILDTEGLDSIQGGKYIQHFDRTMVLFCLAVSQVVIINLKGEIGETMQNLLQTCACSLLKLKVSKVAVPKVFFVLNQQLDRDKTKYIDQIKILLNTLDEKSEFMETEGTSLSQLINISEENLFILGSAFNATMMNSKTARLFDSKVIKQSPAEDFVESCTKLRQVIIDSLQKLLPKERLPFTTMGQWMEMSGVIWDIIVKYQDIVKHKNIQEIKCYNILNREIACLVKRIMRDDREIFDQEREKLIEEVKEIDKPFTQLVILEEKMVFFDNKYEMYKEKCLTEYKMVCEGGIFKGMNYICEDMKSYLRKLLDIERNYYRDEIQHKVRACWYDQNLSHLKDTLKKEINKNIDINLDLNTEQLKEEYEKIWSEWSRQDLKEEEENERNKLFDDLYILFKMESKMMENKHIVFELFHSSNFQMDGIIQILESTIVEGFQTYRTGFACKEDYIYPWRENSKLLREMSPYLGKSSDYIREDSLYTVVKNKIKIRSWVPIECKGLIRSCSGYYNHADITWKTEERLQIKKLASCLKDPDNSEETIWPKFIHFISSEIQNLLNRNAHVTAKEIIHLLSSAFNQVNHEINYIQAKLTNMAEMTITTLAFAHTFKHRSEMRMEKMNEYILKREKQKLDNCEFFLEQVNTRKLARGNWDRTEMRKNDEKSADRCAREFLESVRLGVLNDQTQFILGKLDGKKEGFSHRTIIKFIENLITEELNNQPEIEVTDSNNLVIQYVCNRNELIKTKFNIHWEDTINQVYVDVIHHMKSVFHEKLGRIKKAFIDILTKLSSDEKELFYDSDSNFELANRETYTDPNSDPNLKESPLRAMTLYLNMSLDPNVTPEKFKNFFENTFVVDGIKMIKKTKTWKMCEKSNDPDLILSKETFKKLTDTKMILSDNIFNIISYTKQFLSSLNGYEYELTKTEYQVIVEETKEKYIQQAIGCLKQCPSCGKFCQREENDHAGKCQIITGHQICSMGGAVWKSKDTTMAVLITCDDYKEVTKIEIPGRKLKWEEFKNESIGWNWEITKDKDYLILQENNRKKLQKMWNRFGRGILNRYSEKGINIDYIPYTTHESVLMDTLEIFDYRICFVIDGTGSMSHDIVGARDSVEKLISEYQRKGHNCEFATMIYRDHCDGEDLLDKFPVDCNFTNDHLSVQEFLQKIKVFGGGDGPEAVLDGLAAAINIFTLPENPWIKQLIVHIFDAPPHGDFPNYTAHGQGSDKGNCCCCNKGGLCPFEWQCDVWERMRHLKIEYHGINTGKEFPLFAATMEKKLGEQFRGIQNVDKRLVNEAIFHIFINIVH